MYNPEIKIKKQNFFLIIGMFEWIKLQDYQWQFMDYTKEVYDQVGAAMLLYNSKKRRLSF
jgi:hypothetical protein